MGNLKVAILGSGTVGAMRENANAVLPRVQDEGVFSTVCFDGQRAGFDLVENDGFSCRLALTLRAFARVIDGSDCANRNQ
jgi:hypothetical protein